MVYMYRQQEALTSRDFYSTVGDRRRNMFVLVSRGSSQTIVEIVGQGL